MNNGTNVAAPGWRYNSTMQSGDSCLQIAIFMLQNTECSWQLSSPQSIVGSTQSHKPLIIR